MSSDIKQNGAPRVAFVTEATAWGGSEYYLSRIIAEAVKRGWAARVFCPTSHPFAQDPSHLLDPSVVVEPFGAAAVPVSSPAAPSKDKPSWRGRVRRMLPRSARLLAGIQREIAAFARRFDGRDFDLVYFGIIGCPHLAIGIRNVHRGALVGRFCLTPSDRPADADWVHRRLERQSLACFDRLIANSRLVSRQWQQRCGIPAQKLSLIYNGIPDPGPVPESERKTRRQQLGLENRIVLGTTARLHPMKGHRVLLDAMRILLERRRDLACLFVGDGPSRDEIERQANEAGLRAHVRLTGFRRDASRLASLYDIAVLPSLRDEGLPFALLEAMAHGRPCVASRLAGIPEAVRDGKTGLLVPPADAGALAAAIEEIASENDTARAMGRSARQRYEVCFTEDRMIRETFRLFEGMMKQPVEVCSHG